MAIRAQKNPNKAKRIEMNGECRRLYRASKKKPAYLLCPFHKEKTASCVIYRKGVNGSRKTHFHCYGCGAQGNLSKLFRELQKTSV